MRTLSLSLAALLTLATLGHAYGEETLRFPEYSIGKVMTRPEALSDFGYDCFGVILHEGWNKLASAQGEVTVPDGHVVKLELVAAAARDLNWIDNLPIEPILAIQAYRVPIDNEGVAKLSRFTNLRYLMLNLTKITSGFSQHLHPLNRLQYLWISSNESLGDEAMVAIAKLPQLESLGIHNTAVTDNGLREISKSKSLCAIYAGRTNISDKGLEHLSKLPDLRALNVYATKPEFRDDEPNPNITEKGIAALESCTNLEGLDLTGSSLTDAGLESLTLKLTNLRQLVLCDTQVTQEGLKSIGNLKHLESFRCYGIPINDSVVEHFGSMKGLRKLIGDIEVSNVGALSLASLPILEELELSGFKNKEPLNDDCMKAIASMKSLKSLSIQGTQVTDAGFAMLANSPSLERIQLTRNKMTTRCVETLATMPNLKRVGLMDIDPRTDGEPLWKGLEKLRSLEEEIWLYDCPKIASNDFAVFSNFTQLKNLRIHGIHADNLHVIEDQDIRQIKSLDNLNYLELTNTVLTDEGLKVIADLPSLQRIDINCLATKTGLAALLSNPELTYLRIGSPFLTDEDVQSVQNATQSIARIQLTNFKFGSTSVSRSLSKADDFWRRGTEEKRDKLNQLEGKIAPSIEASQWMNVVDDATTLDDLRGKVVLIDFWGTWCGPCLAKIPHMRKLHATYAEQGLVVLGVHSTKKQEKMAAYVEDNKLPYLIGIDEENKTSSAYEVAGWPSFYLIDRKGVLRMAGIYDGELDEAIQFLLAE